jgi:hypothetical protein
MPYWFPRLVMGSVAAGIIVTMVHPPASCRPASPSELGTMVSEADTIVVGRVVDIAWPHGLPAAAMGGPPLCRQMVTISVSAIFKGQTDLPATIMVAVASYNPARNQAFAAFFLKRRPGGTYGNANIDNWAVSVKQVNPARRAIATDPLEAVTLEMLAILGTPSAQLDDPASGAMHLGDWDTMSWGFHGMAAFALSDVPAAYVVRPLEKLVASPDQAIRIWAAGSLLRHRDYDVLPVILPDLMSADAEALTAAEFLGTELRQEGLPKSTAPILIDLLTSRVASLRQAAGEILGRLAPQRAVALLGAAIAGETDVEAMRGEVQGLCWATATRTPPCDKVGWHGYQIENPPLWRAWALAQAHHVMTAPYTMSR